MPLRRREWLSQDDLGAFDLIFADAWPGKFSHLDEALSLLSPGGFYVIDDLSRSRPGPKTISPASTPWSRPSRREMT